MPSAKKKAKAAAKARRYEWQCWSPFPKAFQPNPAAASTSEGKADGNDSDCGSMPELVDIESSSEEDINEVFERSGLADEANELDSSDDDDDAINVHGLCPEALIGWPVLRKCRWICCATPYYDRNRCAVNCLAAES